MLFNTAMGKRMTWAAGYFLPADNFGKYVGNKYNLTGRVTGTPIYNNTVDKYQLLHLGAGYTYQYQDNEKYILQSRPESHLIPTLVLAEIDQLTKPPNARKIQTIVPGCPSLAEIT